MTKLITGIALVIAGIIASFYVSVVLLMVGGIWDLIHFAQSGYVTYNLLAWGVVKLFCMTPAGAVAAYTLIVPGVILIENAE